MLDTYAIETATILSDEAVPIPTLLKVCGLLGELVSAFPPTSSVMSAAAAELKLLLDEELSELELTLELEELTLTLVELELELTLELLDELELNEEELEDDILDEELESELLESELLESELLLELTELELDPYLISTFLVYPVIDAVNPASHDDSIYKYLFAPVSHVIEIESTKVCLSESE